LAKFLSSKKDTANKQAKNQLGSEKKTRKKRRNKQLRGGFFSLFILYFIFPLDFLTYILLSNVVLKSWSTWKSMSKRLIVYPEGVLSNAKGHFKGGWLLGHCPTQTKFLVYFRGQLVCINIRRHNRRDLTPTA